jgi:hypothetical protein
MNEQGVPIGESSPWWVYPLCAGGMVAAVGFTYWLAFGGWLR